jgi:NADH-ubiquinone oxidoreductase chain 2
MQAFVFYLIQYSISNLNIFLILIAIGFSFFYYITDNKDHIGLLDRNNSPIQLINQLRGFFFLNPILALSLTITIFSFVGIPPLIGFFAKQMVLSAALDSGYIFLALVGILTSVIGAVYYLNIIKEVFFFSPECRINPLMENIQIKGNIYNNNGILQNSVKFNLKNIIISSPMSISVSIITLIIVLFIFINKE